MTQEDNKGREWGPAVPPPSLLSLLFEQEKAPAPSTWCLWVLPAPADYNAKEPASHKGYALFLIPGLT